MLANNFLGEKDTTFFNVRKKIKDLMIFSTNSQIEFHEPSLHDNLWLTKSYSVQAATTIKL